MPLQLGDTAPRQRILWDPTNVTEMAEAADRINLLVSNHFTIVERDDQVGEALLIPPARSPHQGLMRVLSQNGDDRLVWDRRIAQQVREAFDQFGKLVAKGFRAYAVLANGDRGHELHEFDPMAEEILMVPTGQLVPG